MEPGSPKKIQFDVPPLQGQLDPQAAEHIRRRRPTPATLQIYRQPGSDVGDVASGDSQAAETTQRKQGTYAPPTMTELQLGMEQHLLGAGLCEMDSQTSPITAQLYANASLWANHNGPEEANGNEATVLLANEERGVVESNSSGGKRSLKTYECLFQANSKRQREKSSLAAAKGNQNNGKLESSVPEEDEEANNQAD